MAGLVLCGTGLFGIVLSIGTFLVIGSGNARERTLDYVVSIARFAVPLLLVLVYLHARYDLAPMVTDMLGTFLDNVEGLQWH
jgi:hypothetical protein